MEISRVVSTYSKLLYVDSIENNLYIRKIYFSEDHSRLYQHAISFDGEFDAFRPFGLICRDIYNFDGSRLESSTMIDFTDEGEIINY